MPKDKVVVIHKELGLDSKGNLLDVNRHPGQNEVSQLFISLISRYIYMYMYAETCLIGLPFIKTTSL